MYVEYIYSGEKVRSLDGMERVRNKDKEREYEEEQIREEIEEMAIRVDEEIEDEEIERRQKSGMRPIRESRGSLELEQGKVRELEQVKSDKRSWTGQEISSKERKEDGWSQRSQEDGERSEDSNE